MQVTREENGGFKKHKSNIIIKRLFLFRPNLYDKIYITNIWRMISAVEN